MSSPSDGTDNDILLRNASLSDSADDDILLRNARSQAGLKAFLTTDAERHDTEVQELHRGRKPNDSLEAYWSPVNSAYWSPTHDNAILKWPLFRGYAKLPFSCVFCGGVHTSSSGASPSKPRIFTFHQCHQLDAGVPQHESCSDAPCVEDLKSPPPPGLCRHTGNTACSDSSPTESGDVKATYKSVCGHQVSLDKKITDAYVCRAGQCTNNTSNYVPYHRARCRFTLPNNSNFVGLNTTVPLKAFLHNPLDAREHSWVYVILEASRQLMQDQICPPVSGIPLDDLSNVFVSCAHRTRESSRITTISRVPALLVLLVRVVEVLDHLITANTDMTAILSIPSMDGFLSTCIECIDQKYRPLFEREHAPSYAGELEIHAAFALCLLATGTGAGCSIPLAESCVHHTSVIRVLTKAAERLVITAPFKPLDGDSTTGTTMMFIGNEVPLGFLIVVFDALCSLLTSDVEIKLLNSSRDLAFQVLEGLLVVVQSCNSNQSFLTAAETLATFAVRLLTKIKDTPCILSPKRIVETLSMAPNIQRPSVCFAQAIYPLMSHVITNQRYCMNDTSDSADVQEIPLESMQRLLCFYMH